MQVFLEEETMREFVNGKHQRVIDGSSPKNSENARGEAKVPEPRQQKKVASANVIFCDQVGRHELQENADNGEPLLLRVVANKLEVRRKESGKANTYLHNFRMFLQHCFTALKGKRKKSKG